MKIILSSTKHMQETISTSNKIITHKKDICQKKKNYQHLWVARYKCLHLNQKNIKKKLKKEVTFIRNHVNYNVRFCFNYYTLVTSFK